MTFSTESVIMSNSTLGRSGRPVCNIKTAGQTNPIKLREHTLQCMQQPCFSMMSEAIVDGVKQVMVVPFPILLFTTTSRVEV